MTTPPEEAAITMDPVLDAAEAPKENPDDYELELLNTQLMATFVLRDKRTGKIRRQVQGEPWNVPIDEDDFDGMPWFEDYVDHVLVKAVDEIGTAEEPNRALRRQQARDARRQRFT